MKAVLSMKARLRRQWTLSMSGILQGQWRIHSSRGEIIFHWKLFVVCCIIFAVISHCIVCNCLSEKFHQKAVLTLTMTDTSLITACCCRLHSVKTVLLKFLLCCDSLVLIVKSVTTWETHFSLSLKAWMGMKMVILVMRRELCLHCFTLPLRRCWRGSFHPGKQSKYRMAKLTSAESP